MKVFNLSRWLLIAIVSGMGCTLSLSAADLVGIFPVTDQILMLQFDEGHIDYSGIDPSTGNYEGQWGDFQKLYYQQFDKAKAEKIGNYQISINGRQLVPTAIYMKAKGKEYNDPEANDGLPDVLLEYRIYLVLPEKLQSGQTYTVGLKDLATNGSQFEFTFDPFVQVSPSLHVNQHGFLPNQPKYAYLSHWAGTGGGLDMSGLSNAVWHIYDLEAKQVVRSYNGSELQKPAGEKDNNPYENFSMADVWSLDFSDFTESGSYQIVVEGLGSTYPFEIRTDIYREPFYVAMRGLYFQRAGIVKRLDEFNNQVYPRAHHSDQLAFYYDENQQVYGHSDIDNFDYSKPLNSELFGWYYDAGDWDHYANHWNLPTTLLFLYNLKPNHFHDGQISNQYKRSQADQEWINEGNNGIPDLVDEARWMLDFGKRFRSALLQEGYGTGGVPGYVGEDAGASRPSWTEERRMRVCAEMPASTYSYAGSAALFAHTLRQFSQRGIPVNEEEIADWITEALEAFSWAEGRHNPNSGGEVEARELAAACLYLLTGEENYQAIFQTAYESSNASQFNGQWLGLSNYMIAQGVYTLLCQDKSNLNSEFRESVVRKINNRASRVIGDELGYRLGGVENGQWIKLNLVTVPRTIFQILSYELTGEDRYLQSIYNTVAYHLGGNPENLASMTGLGDNPEQDAFHPDSWFLLDYNDQVYRNPILPGFTVYGRKQFDVGGIGNESRGIQTFLPPVSNEGNYLPWPIAEGRTFSRWSISGSEFTVHQNQVWTILAFGYLLGEHPDAFVPNHPPTVQLDLDDIQFYPVSDAQLQVDASEDTRRVDYFYDWHFLGSSTDQANRFLFKWNPTEYGLEVGQTVELTAVAYDDQGKIAVYNDAADKVVQLTDAVTATEVYPSASIRLFPNPAPKGSIQLLANDLFIGGRLVADIKDITGRTLRHYQIEPSGSQLNERIEAALSAGLYILQVRVDDTLIHQSRFVVP